MKLSAVASRPSGLNATETESVPAPILNGKPLTGVNAGADANAPGSISAGRPDRRPVLDNVHPGLTRRLVSRWTAEGATAAMDPPRSRLIRLLGPA